MKYSLVAAATLAGQAAAFPAKMFEAIAERQPESYIEMKDKLQKRQAFGVNVGFDPAKQYISTSGANKFVAPGPNDIRGPCPGLNALANHNCKFEVESPS